MTTAPRLVRFRTPAGFVREGDWTENGIRAGGRTYTPENVEILPPTEPTKVVCVGMNYRDHVAELGHDEPEEPTLFVKPPNTVTGHGAEVVLPTTNDRYDPEAELGVVIGKQCHAVTAEDAMDVVAGYTCVNDLSNRDLQFTDDGFDLFRGKTFDGAAPIGPVVAPPESVPDDAVIELRVNGDRRQQSSIDQLIFGVEALIEEITAMMTLEPGDIVSTGTPAGIAPIDDGDTVEIAIDGIGSLVHTVHRP